MILMQKIGLIKYLHKSIKFCSGYQKIVMMTEAQQHKSINQT